MAWKPTAGGRISKKNGSIDKRCGSGKTAKQQSAINRRKKG